MLMPGNVLSTELLPTLREDKALNLGPGLRHTPPSTITATFAGQFETDSKRGAVWVESVGGRYLPHVGDLVIATVHHSSADTFNCTLTAHTPLALLGQLAFEGATKKTRPMLNSGMLVYARVKAADKWADVELMCCDPNTGKADGLGPLKGGTLFDISLALARRLVMPDDKSGLVILEEIGAKIRFEVAIGRNGKVWVSATHVNETIAIGRILSAIDQQNLDVDQQRKLVKSMLKNVTA